MRHKRPGKPKTLISYVGDFRTRSKTKDIKLNKVISRTIYLNIKDTFGFLTHKSDHYLE